MVEPAVIGVVLGAGKSERFGSPKQLLAFEETTLLGRVVQNANCSRLDRVVVVLGRAADEIRKVVDFGRSEIADNTRYGTGCASSLLAGLDAAGPCAALVLLLGDQPGVTAATIDRVLAEWRQARPWAAVTSYRGVPGHPFVFAAEAFPELRKLHGDKAVWKLIEARPELVLRIDLDAELPPDVDEPGDYALALEHWQRVAGIGFLDRPPALGHNPGRH